MASTSRRHIQMKRVLINKFTFEEHLYAAFLFFNPVTMPQRACKARPY
jgi:hypothetical protein